METSNISLRLSITDPYWKYYSNLDVEFYYWVPGFGIYGGRTASEARSLLNQGWCFPDLTYGDYSWLITESLATFDCADHDHYLPWDYEQGLY